MLTSKTQYSLANAKTYFSEHLSVGDYYTGERLGGAWFGAGAKELGLTGKVGETEFLKLCDNLHPMSGELLTQRKKTFRREVDSEGNNKEVANRRVFYDFTISTPKSVSILAFVAKDDRIIEAHDRATGIAMRELEAFAAARVRIGGQSSRRATGNVVGARFRHDTSRALDPHLHTHCIFFNASFDHEENRWKALENIDMFRAQKYVESVYYHELARDLRQFGYEIENHPRGDFEVKGVSKELCERFSKRHKEIDARTSALLERCPEKADGNLAEIRENIAYYERSRKIKDIPIEELQARWNGELTKEERSSLSALVEGSSAVVLPEPTFAIAEDAITWAEDHLFERRSVIREKDLWRVALERVRGEDVSVEDLKAVTQKTDYIRYSHDPDKITTEEMLNREIEIVQTAKYGANRFEPLSPDDELTNQNLDRGQREAVAHILSSRDLVTLFRGGAGTGKSYTLREVEAKLLQTGRGVHVIAPQRQQVMDLARDGFNDPKTVSEFLISPGIREGDVVIVDEAGQIGASQMQALFGQIESKGGRIILSGDTRQHGAVEASDALWAIEKYSGLRAAELQEIRRQDPAKARNAAERKFIEAYKQAVEEAAKGDIAASFHRLDDQGAVLECPPGEQQQWLAAHYLEHARKGETTLVVAQTWSEIYKVNETVREALKAEGFIKKRERTVTALERTYLTDAQKKDARFYTPSSVLVFNRNACGFKKGQVAKLVSIAPNGLLIESEDKAGVLSNRYLGHITICEQKELPLLSGDRLQLKANARIGTGQRLANGELVTVKSVEANGTITLKDGRVIPANYRQFGRGYAVTSYASQGKTVDYVLFSDSAIRAATNSQQWYVSISRGRKGIRIFTADKEQLRENVSQLGERSLALDLVDGKPPQQAAERPLPGYRMIPGIKTLKQYAMMMRLRMAAWAIIHHSRSNRKTTSHDKKQSI